MKNLKKITALVLAVVMMLAVAACGGGDKKDDAAASVDFSKYPAALEDWTPETFNQYFTDCGLYTNKDYVYYQDHATYYYDTYCKDASGYMDDTGDELMWVVALDKDYKNYDAIKKYIAENKKLSDETGMIPDAVDHMLGDFLFTFAFSQSDDFVDKSENAIKALADHYGVDLTF